MSDDPELIRAAVARIKALAQTRTPPYELPADSLIEAAVRDIFMLRDAWTRRPSVQAFDADGNEYDVNVTWEARQF